MCAKNARRAGFVLRLWVWLSVCWMFVLPLPGWANNNAGLAWLTNQVQSAGQLAAASARASAQQSQCEVAKSLLALSGSNTAVASLTAALDSSPLAEVSTEVLACTRRLQLLLGQVPQTSDLLNRRVSNQGFVAFAGHSGPSLLDTGWALETLADQWTSSLAQPSISWLQARQQPDGSFHIGGHADLLTTALLLRGLHAHRDLVPAAAAASAQAAAYLLRQVHSEGHWYSDAGLTALIYEAVHPYTASQASLAPSVRNWLASRQSPNGSWDNDPWVTALALRALALTSRPPVSPGQAALKIQFVDATTTAPIQGVALAVTGPSSVTGTSDAAGVALLQGLTPGVYSMSASAGGYRTTQLSATVRAGQLTDLGTVQLLAASSSTQTIVTGTVRDSVTNAPIDTATVSITGQAVSGITDAQGRYLITGVTPGLLNLKASKSGYADASAQAQVLAGQTFVYSPVLVPSGNSGPGNTDCKIVGTVTRASDGTPLPGAAVTLTGSNSASTVTDASGAYVLASLVSGETRISVSLTGFDTAVANTRVLCSTQGPTALRYSPKLYPGNQSPVDANTAGLRGWVMDAATNRPLAGVQLAVSTSYGINRNAISQADGSFAVSGLDGAQAQVAVTASGYQGVTLGYSLEPGQMLEIGQIRLRLPSVEQISLDLQLVSVKRHTARTHAQTLRVSGAVEAQLRNAGTQASPANVVVLAFQDTNLNGVYDANTDLVLGQSVLNNTLQPGQSQTLYVDVAGLMPFRDAPIHVVVDPQGSIAESSKANNVRSTAQDILFVPQGQTFTPKLKWEWNAVGDPFPNSKDVMMAPIAIPTRDTNGDGKVDGNDVSDIIVVSHVAWYFTVSGGAIRIIDGSTGRLIRTIAGPEGVTQMGGLAAADLDGDGLPEIVATSSGTGLAIAYRIDGTVYWAATQGSTAGFYRPNGGAWGSAVIADMNGDGVPEVIMKGDVYNGQTGALLWSATDYSYGSTGGPLYSLPVVADLFETGQQNLILGAAVYDSSGRLLWKNDAVFDGHVAVADFNRDGIPEILIHRAGRLWLLSRDGQILWGPVVVPNATSRWGGPPTVADFNGDGYPDIGVAGEYGYTAVRHDGAVMWHRVTKDYGSGMTGSTAFDFLGDGKAKVIYGDESSVFIYDGESGDTLMRIPSDSATALEYPIVVDADRDGRAEFVTVRNFCRCHSDHEYGSGVRMFEDANGNWVPTRGIWNQHAYTITNINDDLSVPRRPEPSWKSHNTFRLNRRMDADPRAIADLTASYVRVRDLGAQPGSQLTVRVGNGGSYKVPSGTSIAVYRADPALGQPPAQALVARGSTQAVIETGGYEDVVIALAQPLAQLSAQGALWIVADDDGTGGQRVPDFDRSNNVALADLPGLALNAAITVATDKPVYGEAESAVFTARVQNSGSFSRDFTVRLTVIDSEGRTVEVLALQSVAGVGPAQLSPVQTSWAASAVLAGNYAVRAELLTAEGVAYAGAIAPFAVRATSSTGTVQSLNAAKVITDRSRYSQGDTVIIDSRVSNLSTNLLQENLRAVTQVIDANGRVVLSRSEVIPQATPRSHRKYGYQLKASGLVPGVYQVRIQLWGAPSYKAAMAGTAKSNAPDVELAVSTSSFSVQNAAAAAGIAGQLQATPSPVAIGSNANLQLTVTNNSGAAISGATVRVRVIDPASGTAIATFAQANVQMAAGANVPFNWSWTAAGTPGTSLPVAAAVEIAGVEQALVQTSLVLSASASAGLIKPVPLHWHWLIALSFLMPLLGARGRRRICTH
ncbi:MAG: carboxypeptidase regulatory-like domain-containing protein [Burkholderiaceae bacterium]